VRVSDERGRPTAGLRERKKAATRAALQRHALRLFQQQGYDATTIDQIAGAAQVSPATLFRYFPTKEDLVVSDDYDPMIAAAFARQPADASPVEALRRGISDVFAMIPPEEVTDLRERVALILAVPQLRATTLRNLTETMDLIAGLVAERTGRGRDELAVRSLSGAIVGVLIAVLFHWAEHPDEDLATALDEGLGHLERGLPL
jgi:AcrR family transcriptional regulator